MRVTLPATYVTEVFHLPQILGPPCGSPSLSLKKEILCYRFHEALFHEV